MSFLVNNEEEVYKICEPLHDLNIRFFMHGQVTPNREVSTVCNHKRFLEYYLKNKLYNFDVYGAKDILGSYVLWDCFKGGNRSQLQNAFTQFSINQVFTIIKENKDGVNYYHFGTQFLNYGFNQRYLSNIQLLEFFISYFHLMLQKSDSLSTGYKSKCIIENVTGSSSFTSPAIFQFEDKKLSFKEKIVNNSELLTKRERDCLKLYVRGKTAKEVGVCLGLSPRTVEHYLLTAKEKLKVSKKSELIEKVFSDLCWELP